MEPPEASVESLSGRPRRATTVKSEPVLEPKAKPRKKSAKSDPTTKQEKDEATKASLGGANTIDQQDSESYRKNQIYILKCFSEIININNDNFVNLLTDDKSNINYNSINSIEKYCLSLLMLQIYKSFNSYTPRLESIENILNDIEKLNENESPLSDAINIRNYYSQIIDTFMIIEYLQSDVVSYVMALNENFTYNTNNNVIYKLNDNLQINYNMLLFIIDNLLILNTQENEMVSDLVLSNFYIITTIVDIFKRIDIDLISEYYNSSKSPDNENFYTVNNYEYICVFLIKYINQLFLMIPNNQVDYSNQGLLYNYEDLTQKLTAEGLEPLVKDLNTIQINMNKDISKNTVALKNIQQSDNLPVILNNIKDLLLNLIDSSTPAGFKQKIVSSRDLTKDSTIKSTIGRALSQGGRSHKNKKFKIYKKTKKNKKNNTKNKTNKLNKIEKKTRRKNR